MPPKKKAKTVKKPSPAYLAELEKLKRTKRKYVLGNQETAEFLLYPAEWTIRGVVKRSVGWLDLFRLMKKLLI